MNWIILGWALTFGYMPANTQAIINQNRYYGQDSFIDNSNSYAIKLELSADILGHLKIWGSDETYMKSDFSHIEYGAFSPSEAHYRIGAYLYAKGIEVGIEHECDHGIEASYDIKPWYWGGYTEVYIKLSGSSK